MKAIHRHCRQNETLLNCQIKNVSQLLQDDDGVTRTLANNKAQASETPSTTRAQSLSPRISDYQPHWNSLDLMLSRLLESLYPAEGAALGAVTLNNQTVLFCGK